MAQRDRIEINIDIGEDFAAQIMWTDDDGIGYPITTPCRMDVRDTEGTLVMQFETGNTGATEATITLTSVDGFMQLTAPASVTTAIEPGSYLADLFATVDNTSTPFADQLVKVFSANVLAYPRQTIMES